MATRRTRAELAALRVQRIPDNPLHVITPAAVRDQLADMDASALNPADDGLPTGGGGGAASFGTLGGQPEDNPALEARLRRGPNAAPSAAVHIVRYARESDPRWTPGVDTLDSLEATPGLLGLKHRIEVIDPLAGEPEGYRVMYSPTGFVCWRDGSNQSTSQGECVDANSVRAQAQPYGYYGPSYSFLTTDLVRAFPADNPATERFFSPSSDGPRPAPTLEAGDANWLRVDEVNVPMPGIGQVQFDALEGRVEYTEAAIFLHGNRLSALEGGAAMYVAHKSDGTVNSAFTSLRQATDWMGDGGRVFLNRPQGAPVPSNILIGGGSTLDLQGHPLNLGGHDLHLYSGAQVLNNRLIYNGRVFLRDGISPARPQLIQGGVIAAQIYQQTGIAEAVTLDGVLVTNFGQGGAATVGAFTVTLLNGAQFFDYAPDAATTVVTVPARLDPYISAAGAIGSAVVAGAFTNGELQGAQPTGSLPGMEFTTTTYAYKYQRGAAGSLVWCRYAKS